MPACAYTGRSETATTPPRQCFFCQNQCLPFSKTLPILAARLAPHADSATAGGSKLNQRDCMQADWTRVWPSI